MKIWKKIFDKKWNNLIESILDDSKDLNNELSDLEVSV